MSTVDCRKYVNESVVLGGDYMKLKDCLELAKDRELETVGEALYNVNLHSGNLFAYSEIHNELTELQQEFIQSKFTKETKVSDALALM